MSSLVLKQRQKPSVKTAATEPEKQSPGQQQSPAAMKVPLKKRSVSFEKLLVTAFQIRLACEFVYFPPGRWFPTGRDLLDSVTDNGAAV